MDTNTLRNLDVSRYGIEEMVELSAHAGMMIAHYDELELEVPEWLNKARTALLGAINEKNRGRIEARKKEIEARLDALTPVSEKRAQLAGELKRLKSKLGEGGK